jgi:CYTH domain-containing protein
MGGMELERKWLVERAPPEVLSRPADHIEQGYLAVGEDGSEVRLRRRAGDCSLTVKAGRGLSRQEFEVELGADQFEALWPGTEGRRIVKSRRVLGAGGDGEGPVIEFDEYGGELAGLCVAEVEFPDERTAREFAPPDWFGREVTEDDAYKNRRLALDGRPQLNG